MKDAVIRVLVVDDHPIVRSGLCTQINLDKGMQVAGEAVDGLEAVDMARSLRPDVILMDIVMPRMNGIEATAQIVRENPQACVLVLTSFTEEENIFASLKAGAMGYIFKDQYPDEMLQAIRDVYHGQPQISPMLTRRLLHEIRKPNRDTSRETSLTEREMEILRLVAGGAPYKEIAHQMSIRQTTVRTHVSNILKKLNLANRSQLVLYVINHKMVEPPEKGSTKTT